MPNAPREKARIRVTNDKGKETHRKTVHGEVLDIGKNQCCLVFLRKTVSVANFFFSEKVSRHDMGTYTCIAKNNVPPTVSKNFKLTVNFVPQIEVTNQVVGAPVGTKILLRCNIQASPKPMTFWSKKSGKCKIRQTM